MNRPRPKRVVLVFAMLLAALVTVPVGLTWQRVRQDRLNQALIAAVKRNDDQAVVKLLDRGADANAPDETHLYRSEWKHLLDLLHGINYKRFQVRTPLIVALLSSPIDSQPPYSQGFDTHYLPENVALIRSLLDHGARIDERLGERGTTPLMLAVESGKHATIHLLLERGANVNAQESDHSTALIYAVWRSDEETVNELVAHHADVNVREDPLGTALEIAQDNYKDSHDAGIKRIIQALKAAGARS